VTPAVVNGARSRMVLAVGTAKAAPIAGWIRRAGGLPIERVKRTDTTLIIDTPAAGELSAAELSAAELSR
jgi:6-phosphogluconolactonase/glucosamine-6-phosphate isomerase/deaminase